MKQMKFWPVLALTTILWGCGGDSDSSAQPGTMATPGSVADATAVSNGEEIYNNFCSSCHNPGLSGAPKLGDVEAWAPRIAKGKALLLEATIAGIAPAMPPRGMCFSCSDEDLAAAIDYMVESSQ